MATSLVNLATILGSQEKYAEAKPLAERALAIQVKTLRSDHPYIAHTFATLAEIHKALGDDAKAADFAKRAAAIREKKE